MRGESRNLDNTGQGTLMSKVSYIKLFELILQITQLILYNYLE